MSKYAHYVTNGSFGRTGKFLQQESRHHTMTNPSSPHPRIFTKLRERREEGKRGKREGDQNLSASNLNRSWLILEMDERRTQGEQHSQHEIIRNRVGGDMSNWWQLTVTLVKKKKEIRSHPKEKAVGRIAKSTATIFQTVSAWERQGEEKKGKSYFGQSLNGWVIEGKAGGKKKQLLSELIETNLLGWRGEGMHVGFNLVWQD